ncbi:putative ribonuclease H-like domain-containing protein [Tanacetum coccineum]
MCDKKNSVLFNDTECIVLSPNIKLIDESQVLLRVPRKNNMYSVDLKNIVPKGGLTCLFAKATSDESKLWHRRLGHLNFKTMNKLVKGNLVRGLPSKLFENDQTCVACEKGKQHRASCKSKTENSISLPLHLLHMDLFGPIFVKSLMKKMYCLVVTDDYSRFTWVLFLATKDETSDILKSFITGIENLVDHKVKLKLSMEIVQLQDLVDEKKIIITESTVRRDLQLEDAEGVDCLPNATIFEQLALIGLDEAVYKELDDSLETPNESGSLETTSGGGPRCQETMGDTITQTRFENVSKLSNDPLLARAKEIVSLKRRVKKLEQKKRSKTHGLKRLYKVGAIARVESSRDEESLGEDASKQGRINAIDADEDIALVNDQDDADIFDVNTLTGDEVLAELEVVVKYVNLTVNEVTLAQALAALKSVKPKVKANVVEEQVYQLVLPVQRLDEEIASKLQVEFDEEERLAWEKDEANVTLTEE